MIRAGAISGPVGASGDESPRRERAETRELPVRGGGAMGVGGGPHAAPAAPRETAGLEIARGGLAQSLEERRREWPAPSARPIYHRRSQPGTASTHVHDSRDTPGAGTPAH